MQLQIKKNKELAKPLDSIFYFGNKKNSMPNLRNNSLTSLLLNNSTKFTLENQHSISKTKIPTNANDDSMMVKNLNIISMNESKDIYLPELENHISPKRN